MSIFGWGQYEDRNGHQDIIGKKQHVAKWLWLCVNHTNTKKSSFEYWLRKDVYSLPFFNNNWSNHSKKYWQTWTKKLTKSIRNFEINDLRAYNIVHFCFSIFFYWLHIVQNCRFWSTLDGSPTKIGDSQPKTCFLQNVQHFLSVYYPKLSLLPRYIDHESISIVLRLFVY